MNEYPNQNQSAPQEGGNQDALRDAVQGIQNRYGSPYQYPYNQNQYSQNQYNQYQNQYQYQYQYSQNPYSRQPNQLPPPENRKPKERRPLGFLFAVIGFAAGFIIAAVLLGIVLLSVVKRSGAQSDVVTPEIIGKINSINTEVDKSFLFDTDVDYESGIVKGYMNSLGDPYTVYYTPEEYKELNESMSGTFSGIGVVIQADEQTGLLRVVKAYRNSPAAAAGMQADDLIAKVEGEDISGMDMNLVVSRIRGPEGTIVNVTVYRPSEASYIDMTITRQRIEVETISHKMLDNGIGYIQMDSFDEVTYSQYMSAFNELKASGMKALIVDIRSNGGGLLSSVCNILDEMLPAGLITYTEDKNGKRENYSSNEACVLDVPAAVLVNGNSASASEIFTGAMQDYGKAVIVGTQTFGKGIVQTIMGLSDGSAIKMTTSRYYTPKGVCIHGVGITPDIVVEDDNATEEDEQLEAAVSALLKELGE